MSDKKDIRTDTYGTAAADFQKFGRGASDLKSINEGLDATERLRNDQNAAARDRSGPVGRH